MTPTAATLDPNTAPAPRLTDEQAGALAVVGSSVALSAGAGCGKTTVLTERFVRALDGPTPIPLARLVALTFTNKAARELRDRIRRECRRRLQAAGAGAGADPEAGVPAYWRGVVRGLEAARIGTFHSFCGEVLRRHAVEAGVDPGYSVLDEPVAAALRDEALSLALRDALAHRDGDLMELAVEFGLGAVRQALGSLLANRSGGDIATWADRTPEGLLAHWRDRWEDEVRPGLLGRVRDAAAPILATLAATPLDHPKTLARMGDFAAAVAALDRPGEPVPLVRAVREPATVVGLTGKGCWPQGGAYEAVRDGFKAVREVCDKVAVALAWDEVTTLIAASHGLRLARLAGRARAEYDRLKRLRGAVDHDDLLILTRDLVAGAAPAVRTALSESADLVLVDEFQDTDPVQGEILRQMSGSDEAAQRDGRLFLVGDFKQSIYRFRGADPRLFRRFRAGVAEAGRRDLTENFRSVPGILHFVNALFASSFADNPPLRPGTRPGEATPDDDGPPAVVFSWDAPPAAATFPPTAPAPRSSSRPERPDVDVRRGDEARRLARLLAERLRDGWLIRDPDRPGERRRATPGDVAILFRALADSSSFERALSDEGLDFLVVGGSGFFSQQEVRDLANVLAAVEDPTDAIALAGALRSPFFGLSDDALFWISVEVPTALHAGLDRMTGAKLDRLPTLDRPRAERARRLLSAWRDRKDAEPIATLVDRILNESGYEASLLGESLGDRKRANARKLVGMARRFDEAGGFTLAEYVERLRADLKAATKENQAATTDAAGRTIRLMSIHQAKGLEFPIVVVPDLDRRRPGELRRIAFDPDLGPLVNPVADPDDGTDPDRADEPTGSLGWSVYRALDAQADEAEALRLLYVATTRARDTLILSAATDPATRPASPALTLIDARFDRATGQLRVDLPDGYPIPRIEVVAAPEPASSIPPSPDRIASSRPARPRPPLLEVAKIIDTARVGRRSAPGRGEAVPLPTWVPLDPAASLAAPARRVDQLARLILQDPRGFDPAALAEVAARASRLTDPVSPDSVVRQAEARVRAWLAHLPDLLRDDGLSRSSPWPWRLARPALDGTPPIVFEGTGDLALHDREGGVIVVCIGPSAAPSASEVLRTYLAAHAWQEQSDRPVVTAWWLAWDDPAAARRLARLDDAALDLAVALWADEWRAARDESGAT